MCAEGRSHARLIIAMVGAQECLVRWRPGDEHLRWARVLCEFMKELWHKCEAAARGAHAEIIIKLQVIETHRLCLHCL